MLQEAKVEASKKMKIALNQIVPNPNQPRKYFDSEYIKELAGSIKENGLQQPIKVRPYDGRYQIVIGECRYKSHKLLGLKDIECIVEELTDEQAFKASLIENIHRRNLSPIEEAQAMLQIADKQRDIARKLKISENRISQKLSLLKLPEELYPFFNKLTEKHGRILLSFMTFLHIAIRDTHLNPILFDFAKRTYDKGYSTGHLQEAIEWYEFNVMLSVFRMGVPTTERGINALKQDIQEILDKVGATWTDLEPSLFRRNKERFGDEYKRLHRSLSLLDCSKIKLELDVNEEILYIPPYMEFFFRWAREHGLSNDTEEIEEENRMLRRKIGKLKSV